MPTIKYEGLQIETDDEGYLVNFDSWNEKVARALAQQEGVKNFTSEMFDIINFFRDYYKKYKTFPILNKVCKNVHQSANCFSEQFIDPLKAWKIAGLPNKPPGEVMAYLSYYMK